MPRASRLAVGGVVYHALNRGARGERLFAHDPDFDAFERLLIEAWNRAPVRILSYVLMPTHWHFLLWPVADGDLSTFLGWLTQTHTQRRHVVYGTTGTGAIYRGRFKSFPVESDEHLLTVARYIERNPLRAGLVEHPYQWRWGSLFRRHHPSHEDVVPLSNWPAPRPPNWTSFVERPQTQRELNRLRVCVRRGAPFGSAQWTERAAERLGLESTLRPRGRPKSRA